MESDPITSYCWGGRGVDLDPGLALPQQSLLSWLGASSVIGASGYGSALCDLAAASSSTLTELPFTGVRGGPSRWGL